MSNRARVAQRRFLAAAAAGLSRATARRVLRTLSALGYVAQMQEAGVPVTFGYISDAHDQHGVALSRMEVISYGEEKPVADNKERDGKDDPAAGWR